MKIGRGPVFGKIFPISNSNIKCPSEISKANWLGTATYGDKFKITHVTGGITVVRSDTGNNKHGWGMNLQFKCCTLTDRRAHV